MAEVTVIVPLYNKAPHIDRCLASLQAQTLDDLRIIVVDDGSTDAGPETVARISAGDDRIQLIRQDNAGPASARNTGLAAATSEFVGFVDADDWVDPGMFEVLLKAARACDCVSARCAYSLDREGETGSVRAPSGSGIDASRAEGDAPPLTIRGADLYKRLFAGPDIALMTACAAIYRLDTLRSELIRFDESLRHTEDALFSAEVYSLDLPIAVTDEALYHYRQGEESLSKRHDPDLYRSADRLYELVTALEDSPNQRRRDAACAGHGAFMDYVCWYYTITLADELTDSKIGPPTFAERARRVWDNSRFDEVFARAEREGSLGLPQRSVWRLIRSGRYGLLAFVLRAFNLARAVRRAV